MRIRGLLKKTLHSYCPGLRGCFTYFGTHVYFPDGAYIFHIVCAEGTYEAQLLRLIIGLTKPGTWYFDVGANIGLMSVPVLHSVPECNVYSFEPSPNTIPYLRRTWSESPWKTRWSVTEHAAGSKKETVKFFVSGPKLGGFDGLRHTGRVPCLGQELVSVTTLDTEWNQFGRPQVSCIKLDVEGAELEVLNGSTELIVTCRPYVLLEWYPENFEAFGYEAGDLVTFCEAYDYEVISIPAMSPVHSVSAMNATITFIHSYLLVPKIPANWRVCHKNGPTNRL
jgi:FkbM family methyltransferase